MYLEVADAVGLEVALEKARVHKVHARGVPHIRGLYLYALRQYLYFCTRKESVFVLVYY